MSDAPQAGPSTDKAKNKRPKKKRFDPAAMKPGLAARQAAHRLLGAIIDAHTPMDALTDDDHGHPHYRALEARDRSLVRAILMAGLRHRGSIIATIDRFLDKPLPDGASAVHHIVHVAIAQIILLDIPDHSAVDLAVECATADPRTRRFAPLVNALTRRVVRSKAKLVAQFADDPKHGPAWFMEMLERAYGPERAARIAASHQSEAPLDIAIRRGTIDAQELAAQTGGIVLHDQAVRLPTTGARIDVTALPGFREGHIWVQDVAAGIPAILCGAVAGKRVLDTCAAPGGKTAQLLDRGGHVTALDLSANRLKRLQTNMDRLGLSAHCQTVTASLFDYTPDHLFDAVLVDAPCSSTGTIRRHPDVAWVKTDADIIKLAQLQARMALHAARFVAPGGVLVFSNCSVDPREGEDVSSHVAAGLGTEWRRDPVGPDELAWFGDAVSDDGQVRTTPDMLARGSASLSGCDGFFAARFRRA